MVDMGVTEKSVGQHTLGAVNRRVPLARIMVDRWRDREDLHLDLGFSVKVGIGELFTLCERERRKVSRWDRGGRGSAVRRRQDTATETREQEQEQDQKGRLEPRRVDSMILKLATLPPAL